MLSALVFSSGIIALNYLSNRLTVRTCIFNVEIIIHLQRGFKLAHGRGSFLRCLHSFSSSCPSQPANPVLFLNIFLQVSMLLGKGLTEMLLMPQAYRDVDTFSNRREMGWAELGTSVHPEGPCWEEARSCQTRSWLGALPVSLEWPDPTT